MIIPENAFIDARKLTDYLLAFRERDDKSKYLALAGFTREHPGELEAEIRRLAHTSKAVSSVKNHYGEILRQDGKIKGPSGRELPVSIFWIKLFADGSVRFVTMKPFSIKGGPL